MIDQPHGRSAHWSDKVAHPTAFMLFGVGPAVFPFAPNLITPLSGLFLLSVIVHAVSRGAASELVPRHWRVPACVGGILLLGAFSMVWSIEPGRSFDRVLKLLPIGALLVIALSPAVISVLRPIADTLLKAVAVGCGVGAMVAAADLILGLPLAGVLADAAGDDPAEVRRSFYNRGLTFVLLMALPSLAWLLVRGSTGLAGIVAVSVIAAAVVGASNAMAIAVALAFVVFFAARQASIFVGMAIFAGTGLGALLQPFFFRGIADRIEPADWQRYSVFARLEIWDYVALGIVQRPALGWGLDVTRHLPTMAERVHAFETIATLSTHAHNNFLEIWNNLGIVGLLLALAIVHTVIVNALKLPEQRGLRAIALATISACIVIAFVSYGMWQTTWLAALIVCAVLFRLVVAWAASDAGQRIDG